MKATTETSNTVVGTTVMCYILNILCVTGLSYLAVAYQIVKMGRQMFSSMSFQYGHLFFSITS